MWSSPFDIEAVVPKLKRSSIHSMKQRKIHVCAARSYRRDRTQPWIEVQNLGQQPQSNESMLVGRTRVYLLLVASLSCRKPRRHASSTK